MRNLSKPTRIGLIIVIFALLYAPTAWLWGHMLPAYSQALAAVAGPLATALDFSGTSYEIVVAGADFQVTAQTVIHRRSIGEGRFEQVGIRPAGLVTYNITLWGALFLASVLFLPAGTRVRFLLIPPVVLIFWHLCDLLIFAQNAHWILIKDLSRRFPEAAAYGPSRAWFWWWLFELNRRIIDPFLPVFLWVILCLRAFVKDGIPRTIARR